MANYVRTWDEKGRTPSPRIWGDLAKVRHDAYIGKCILIGDDFGVTTRHANISASGGYYTLIESSGTIQGYSTLASVDLTNALGVLQIYTADTNNAENHIQFGDGMQFRADNASGNTGKILFEARIAVDTVADSTYNLFVGIGGPIVAAGHLSDTGVLVAAGRFIGFQANEDDGNQMDFTYQAASQTQVVKVANAVTLVANTYINVGFKYDPTEVDARKVSFFVNGAIGNAFITTTNIDAAAFPENESMQPMILTGGAVANANTTVSIDWIYAAQYENQA